MGLLKAASGSASGVLSDQWRDYFYCDSLDTDTLVVKGQKKAGKRSSNTKGSENIITNGSVVAVNEGQCMILVDQGKIAEVCAEPGQFVYDSSTQPSIFYGGLGKGILDSFKEFGKRFAFGGEAAKDQRVYFVNTKNIIGNKYGTATPVPFRVIDTNIGLDMDISVRCHGEYSYRIADPILFYRNVCANVTGSYSRSQIDSQLRNEVLTALQPAFARLSEKGIRYSAVAGHTQEVSEAMAAQLSEKWMTRYGIAVGVFTVGSLSALEEDEKMIKELQRNATFRDANMAAAHLVGAQASAMQSAASNTATGSMMAFAGMNMAQNAGGANIANLYATGAQQAQERQARKASQQADQAKAQSWTCPSCGQSGNTGRFCSECGAKQPVQASEGWVCSCGALNKGRFCSECGSRKPAGVPQYRCDKCGWEPADPTKPPKFYPECGDPFGDEDIKK